MRSAAPNCNGDDLNAVVSEFSADVDQPHRNQAFAPASIRTIRCTVAGDAFHGTERTESTALRPAIDESNADNERGRQLVRRWKTGKQLLPGCLCLKHFLHYAAFR